MAEHKWREIGPAEPMPEVGDKVLIVIDVRAWDNGKWFNQGIFYYKTQIRDMLHKALPW